MSFTVRYTTRAQQQKNTLPEAGKRALVGLESKLSANPRSGQENKSRGSWRCAFGGYGDAEYIFADEIVTVTVLYITWVG